MSWSPGRSVVVGVRRVIPQFQLFVIRLGRWGPLYPGSDSLVAPTWKVSSWKAFTTPRLRSSPSEHSGSGALGRGDTSRPLVLPVRKVRGLLDPSEGRNPSSAAAGSGCVDTQMCRLAGVVVGTGGHRPGPVAPDFHLNFPVETYRPSLTQNLHQVEDDLETRSSPTGSVVHGGSGPPPPRTTGVAVMRASYER